MNQPDPQGKAPLRSALAVGWHSVQENWRPFVALQACAALLVLAYYTVPGAKEASKSIQAVKTAGGLPFAILTTAFASCAIPELARKLFLNQLTPFKKLLFQVAFFGSMGLIVDRLYTYLGMLLGTEASFTVVLQKVTLDMLIFTPFLSIPYSALAFLWQDHGFSFSRTRRAIAGGVFAQRYIPILLTCWFYWIPVLAAVYSMPSDLQFPLFLCAQAAWSLLLLHISSRKHPSVTS